MLKWLETRLIILRPAVDLYAGIISVLFMLIGIWISRTFSPTTKKQEAALAFPPAEKASPAVPSGQLPEPGLSNREMEVLLLISKGLSNQEIADALFVSTNTVKTHIVRLYVKLDVNRRTQAIQRARTLGLIR